MESFQRGGQNNMYPNCEINVSVQLSNIAIVILEFSLLLSIYVVMALNLGFVHLFMAYFLYCSPYSYCS